MQLGAINKQFLVCILWINILYGDKISQLVSVCKIYFKIVLIVPTEHHKMKIFWVNIFKRVFMGWKAEIKFNMGLFVNYVHGIEIFSLLYDVKAQEIFRLKASKKSIYKIFMLKRIHVQIFWWKFFVKYFHSALEKLG